MKSHHSKKAKPFAENLMHSIVNHCFIFLRESGTRLLLIMTAICFQSNAIATQEISQPSLKLIDAFIEVMNTPDLTSVTDFVDKHMAQSSLDSFGGEGRARYIGYISDVKLFHGSVAVDDIVLLESSEASMRYQVLVKSRNTDLWYNLTMNLQNNSPTKLASFYLQPTTHPTEQVHDSRITKKQLAENVQHYIQKLTGNGVFSGAILIADNNSVLYKAAEGFSDLENSIKNNIQTKFNLASMNKMFTAIGLLKLVKEKQLSLDDKLVKFVDPTLFPQGDFDKITIRQLLTHTSGLGWSQAPEAQENKETSRKNFKHLILAAKPGSQYRYSNDGMGLLGEVIETVSNTDYYTYIRKNIYKPVGMVNTDSFDTRQTHENLAKGYYFDVEQQKPQDNSDLVSGKGGPAGGGYSTVEDLHRFSNALIRFELLPKELTESAYSAKPELNSPNYGYGFSVQQEDGDRIIGHGGSFIGVSSRLSIYLDKGIILVVLSNKGFVTEPIVWKVNELVNRL